MIDNAVVNFLNYMLKVYPYYLPCLVHSVGETLLNDVLLEIVERRKTKDIPLQQAVTLIHDIKLRLDILNSSKEKQ